ncbi:Commd10 [Columba guinea]|nr:Commd10 [Columba guinea]
MAAPVVPESDSAKRTSPKVYVVSDTLETIGWQLNLQMAESMQAKLKSPQAVLELGMSNEDSKVRNTYLAELE